MVPPLADPIGNRSSLLRHLEPLAEGLGKPLQSRAGQSPNGGEDLLNCAWIERSRLGSGSCCACDWGCCQGAAFAGLVLGEALGAAVAELVTSLCCLS